MDAKKSSRARSSQDTKSGGNLTGGAGVALAILLAAPTFAVMQRGISLLWFVGFVLLMGFFTFLHYASDKRRAEQSRWRISEFTLHLLELLGGWPGAFIAQRKLRHKISKTSYQVVFWTIILTYQFVAIDSLQDWKFTRMTADYFEHRSKSPR